MTASYHAVSRGLDRPEGNAQSLTHHLPLLQGLYLSGSTATVSSTNFTSCSATYYGGGMAMFDASTGGGEFCATPRHHALASFVSSHTF